MGPLAPSQTATLVLDLITKAAASFQLIKGLNEVTKRIRKGNIELVIIASDPIPFEIIQHIPLLCEQKRIYYIFLDGKKKLGRLTGLYKKVSCCAIKHPHKHIIKQSIEKVK